MSHESCLRSVIMEESAPTCYVIAISGATSSGKTSLSKLLQEQYTSDLNSYHVIIISQDDFYKDSENVPFENGYRLWDDHISIDWKALVDQLVTASSDPSRHCNMCQSTSKRYIGHIIIIEGTMILTSNEILCMSMLRFFIKLDYQTCRERRLSRDCFSDDTPAVFDGYIWPKYCEMEQRVETLPSVITIDGNKNIEHIKMIIATTLSTLIDDRDS